jgi:hypothetical protein
LQPKLEQVFPMLANPFIGRKMAPMFMDAGFININAEFEPDRLFSVIGAIDPEGRQNWVEQLSGDATSARSLGTNGRPMNSLARSLLTKTARIAAAIEPSILFWERCRDHAKNDIKESTIAPATSCDHNGQHLTAVQAAHRSLPAFAVRLMSMDAAGSSDDDAEAPGQRPRGLEPLPRARRAASG